MFVTVDVVSFPLPKGPTSQLFLARTHFQIISFEMAYGKLIITGVDLKTRSGPVLYTNALGWPPMLLFAHLGGEYAKLRAHWQATEPWDEGPPIPPVGLALLLLGCVVGTGIGYSGWWCRGQVSAASYTLIGVMNKCLTVLVNSLVWDQHASPEGIVSLCLCLLGGAVYRQAPMRRTTLPTSVFPDAGDIEVAPLVGATDGNGEERGRGRR